MKYSNSERANVVLRILNVRDRLPKNWRKELLRRRPEWDTQAMYVKISNVHRMVTLDLEIVEEMEAIANEAASQSQIFHSRVG